jgi:putative spermidine/putrescine transport system substrate-binding protein
MDSIIGNYGMGFFILLARINGGSEKNIDPGFELAKKLSESAFFFSRSPTDTARVFQEGTAWIGYWGKVRQAMLAETGFPIGFVPAKEGIPPNIMGAAVVKNSKVTELGYELVNYMLSPEAQVNMAKTLFIGPTVKNATLSAEDAERVIYGSEQIEKLMTIDWLTVMERKAEWLERWNKEIQY